MYREDRRRIYKKAMDIWGFDAQSRMLQEECAELIVATSHFIRERPDALYELREELADVYIMVGQIIEYLGPEFVEEMVDLKLERVKEQLDGS